MNPLLSMTGYGRGARIVEGRDLTVELKSVNHRFLDLSFRMPRSFAYLEDSLRNLLQSRLSRGHIDIFITYRNLREDSKSVAVDKALLNAYVSAMQEMSEHTGLENDARLTYYAKFPDVLRVDEAEEDRDALRELALACMNDAIDELIAMRELTNLKGLIYLTDGIGKYPEKPPDYDTAFVFVDETQTDRPIPPWAMKVFMSEDEIIEL